MNTSAHPIAPEEVMAFVDGELSIARNNSVARHIAECEECRQTAAETRSGSQELRAWHVEAVPGRVEENVRARLAQAQGEAMSKRFSSTASKWVLGLGLAAALLVLGQRNSYKAVSPRPTIERQAISTIQPPADVAVPHNAAEPSQTYQRMQEMKEPAQLSESLAGDTPAQRDALAWAYRSTPNPSPAPSEAPMITRTVSLMLVVKDFAAARATLDAVLARHHSYAAELTINTAQGAPRTLNASLRVPAPELAAAVSDFKSLGRVENESQTGEEVTQQHADLVARLKNSRETEQRLQAILQQRTGKISDVLEVEQEIARVRGEIEQMEAEQRGLEHRVDFATIHLNLTDVYQAQLTMPSPSIATRLHNGFVEGFHSAVETLIGIVLFFAEYGPVLVIWVIILVLPAIVLWRRYRRSLATL
ncbi:MAG: DUF4349 domain-containing protein [Candidatus Acidiferrum sp.]|jgi:hypothetical protein